MSTVTKIGDLKRGMINGSIEGVVRRKTELNIGAENYTAEMRPEVESTTIAN